MELVAYLFSIFISFLEKKNYHCLKTTLMQVISSFPHTFRKRTYTLFSICKTISPNVYTYVFILKHKHLCDDLSVS